MLAAAPRRLVESAPSAAAGPRLRSAAGGGLSGWAERRRRRPATEPRRGVGPPPWRHQRRAHIRWAAWLAAAVAEWRDRAEWRCLGCGQAQRLVGSLITRLL